MYVMPIISNQAMDMIRELCDACALSIDKIAKESGLQGYQIQLAKLFLEVFGKIINEMDRNKK